MRRVAVIIRASHPARVAEGLRAALGLSLRGDRIEVVVTDAAAYAGQCSDPAIRRPLATLAALGHEVVWGDAAMARALERADAVEVWS